MTFQLVPPHNHRQNAVERAIKTFKAHFLSTLATCDPAYPITEWDRLIPQSEMTLNLLRPSRCNPRLSAFAYINGQHNYNKVPLAPPGTKVVIHRKPNQRKSWDFHGQMGWYVGPVLEHYWCYRCYIPSTGKEIITDTVKFLPTKVSFLQENFDERFLRTITKLTKLIHPTNNTPLNSILQNSIDIEKAFKCIANVVRNNMIRNIKPLPSHQGIPPTTSYNS